MTLADWKRALSAFGRRLKLVGHKATPMNDREICTLVLKVVRDAMHALHKAKGDTILGTQMYSLYHRQIGIEEANLNRPNITAKELREARERLLSWQLQFVRDSATQNVHFPERLDELVQQLESMPEGEELAPPWGDLPPEWWQKPGRPSQDIQPAAAPAQAPAPSQSLRRSASEFGLTTGTRPAYHHAYAAQQPNASAYGHYPPQSSAYNRSGPTAPDPTFQRGHGRNPLSVSAVSGNPFPQPARASTDRSSTSSGRGSAWSQQAPISHTASPYNPVGPAHASNIDLPIDQYGEEMDPHVMAYMMQQGWRPSMDQGRRY